MHSYRLFEVLDNEHFDTGKVLKDFNAFNDQNELLKLEIVKAIFSLYGFNQYMNYYYVRYNDDNDSIIIYYDYVPGGYKDTWILKKGN